MIGEHSALDLILGASFIVQFVMALLAAASVVSWAIIFRKSRLLGGTIKATDVFEEEFWSGGDLASLYKSYEGTSPTGMASVFVSGFREFSRLRQQAGLSGAQLLEGTRRAMKVAQLRETDRLEQNLSTLATIGSTSPYVGLFGTVWGIMGAFQGLGNVQQATLAVVAPAIAEALLATALGLAAAIPAYIAYNKFSTDAGKFAGRLEGFADDLSTAIQRRLAERV